jgi:riboflavin kinase/FMN adenylyltransferase
MRLLRGLGRLRLPEGGSITTIGVFDGVHLAHARIIGGAVKRARALGLKSVVITFDPHPARVLGGAAGVPSLISLEHRIRLIGALGPDYIVVARFTRSFAALKPEAFASRVLVSKAGAREVYIGDNFYFGRGASAGPASLEKIGRRLGFRVHIVPAVRIGSRRVSSSAIRALVRSGRLAEASRLLGRPVSVYGTVARGARIARELGYPTANINPHHEVTPPSGVYAVCANRAGRIYKGILNIGTRPTFYAPRDREPAIEVHMFGFRRKIYGEDIEVSFIKKIRDERRFRSARDLVRQIHKDERRALAAFDKQTRIPPLTTR